MRVSRDGICNGSGRSKQTKENLSSASERFSIARYPALGSQPWKAQVFPQFSQSTILWFRCVVAEEPCDFFQTAFDIPRVIIPAPALAALFACPPNPFPL